MHSAHSRSASFRAVLRALIFALVAASATLVPAGRAAFTGSDGKGGSCNGTTDVGVPHDQGAGATPIAGPGPFVSSFGP